MAKLPTYESATDLQTGAAGVERDTGVAGQMGRDISNLGKATADIARVWQDAKNLKDEMKRQNAFAKGARVLEDSWEKDPQNADLEAYTKAIDDMRESSLEGWSDNTAKARWEMQINAKSNQLKARFEGKARNRMILEGRAEHMEGFELNHDAYVSGNLQALQDQMDLNQANLEKGFITPVKKVEYDQALETWGYDRGVDMAKTDVAYVLENIDEFNIPTELETQFITAVKQASQQHRKIAEVQMLESQYQNQQTFYKEEEGMTTRQKLRKLKAGADSRFYDKSWAEAKQAAILSAKGIDAKTQMDYYYQVVQMINQAGAEYDGRWGSKAATDFVIAGQEAAQMIEQGYADGQLDDGDRKMLLNRLYTKDRAEAQEKMRDDLAEATMYFQNTMAPADIPYATKEYVDRSKDKKKRGEDLWEKVADEVTAKRQDTSLEEVQKVRRDFVEANYRHLADGMIVQWNGEAWIEVSE
jgi:hypothetical protein